jgi:hypothetical protein
MPETNPRELVERLNKMVATPRVSFNYQEDVDAVAAAAAALSAALDREERLEADNTRLRGLLEAWDGLAGRDRINLVGKNGDSLDEIVLTGMAHLEKMTSGSWYLGLYRPDGSGYQVWLSAAKGPMRADYAELDAREEPEKQGATSTPSGQ